VPPQCTLTHVTRAF